MQTAAGENWIQQFRQRHGRAPRILHVGNIANNAYQNAKLLHAAGADCDVLSADYYDVMGSPEWEDADFTGDVGSLRFPAWHKVDLGGFCRPRWFCAGPRRLAISYLLARRQGRTADADALWKQMARIYRYFCFRENTIFKKPLLFLEKVAFKLLATLRNLGGKRQGAAPAGDDSPAADPLMQRIMADAKALFPARPIALDKHWHSDYTVSEAALYAPLFAEYDLVEAYATDGIWCYLCGIHHYVCFEHGTIREFVTDDSDTTHLALLAYGRSRGFMVTNTDCYDSARYITHATSVPYVLGLHGLPVEDMARRAQRFAPGADLRDRFGVPWEIPLFFCPARHTFAKDAGVFLKGNDLVVRAAACLAETGADFRLVLAGWGDDIGQIRAMVAESPALAEKVLWTPPLGKEAFTRAIACSTAVLDQFYWLVFGGIAFEVMASGRAVLVSHSIPQPWLMDFFGSLPPFYGCDTAEEICEAMQQVLDAPEKARQTAQDAQNWVLRIHSNARIVEKCCELYTLALPQTAPQEEP